MKVLRRIEPAGLICAHGSESAHPASSWATTPAPAPCPQQARGRHGAQSDSGAGCGLTELVEQALHAGVRCARTLECWTAGDRWRGARADWRCCRKSRKEKQRSSS